MFYKIRVIDQDLREIAPIFQQSVRVTPFRIPSKHSGFSLKSNLFLRQFVRHIVFINVAHILNRLLPHIFGDNQLDAAEPLVRIETFFLCSSPKTADAARARVVRRKSQERLVR
jgi:hypothetical protein